MTSPMVPNKPPLVPHSGWGDHYSDGWNEAPWLAWPGIPADAVQVTITNIDGAYIYEERLFNRLRIISARDRMSSDRKPRATRTREIGGGNCVEEVQYQWEYAQAFAVEVWVEEWMSDLAVRRHYEKILGSQFDSTEDWESSTLTSEQKQHAAAWVAASGLSRIAVMMGANPASAGVGVAAGSGFYLGTALMARWTSYGGTQMTAGWRELCWYREEPEIDTSDDRWHRVGEPFPCPGAVDPEPEPEEEGEEEEEGGEAGPGEAGPGVGEGEGGEGDPEERELVPAGWRLPWWWIGAPLVFLIILLTILWSMMWGGSETELAEPTDETAIGQPLASPTGTAQPVADPTIEPPVSVPRVGLRIGQVHSPALIQESFGFVFDGLGVTVDRSGDYDELYAGSWPGSAIFIVVYAHQEGAIPLIADGGEEALLAIHDAVVTSTEMQPGGELLVDWPALFAALGADPEVVCGGVVTLDIDADQGGRLPGFGPDGELSGEGTFQGTHGNCGRGYPISLRASIEP
jgi:hypothetical protein